jgi:hypothetical protein
MRISTQSPMNSLVLIKDLKIDQVKALGNLCQAQIELSKMSNTEVYEFFDRCSVLPEDVEKIQIELKANLEFYKQFAQMTKFL